jgi:hypothetical protein
MIPSLQNLADEVDPEVFKWTLHYLKESAMQRAALADRQMAILGAMNHGDNRSVEGVGQVQTRFHPDHLNIARVLQGANPLDPEFQPWLAKTEGGEYARVRSKGTRPQWGYDGRKAVEDEWMGQKKFTKTYE